jgi:hypothetical protein
MSTTHLITADELMRLSESGLRYELVKGELLTMSPSGEDHGRVTANLTILLGHDVMMHKLGRIYAAETGFIVETDPDTVLAADLAFTRFQRCELVMVMELLIWLLRFCLRAIADPTLRKNLPDGSASARRFCGWSIPKEKLLKDECLVAREFY